MTNRWMIKLKIHCFSEHVMGTHCLCCKWKVTDLADPLLGTITAADMLSNPLRLLKYWIIHHYKVIPYSFATVVITWCGHIKPH